MINKRSLLSLFRWFDSQFLMSLFHFSWEQNRKTLNGKNWRYQMKNCLDAEKKTRTLAEQMKAKKERNRVFGSAMGWPWRKCESLPIYLFGWLYNVHIYISFIHAKPDISLSLGEHFGRNGGKKGLGPMKYVAHRRSTLYIHYSVICSHLCA